MGEKADAGPASCDMAAFVADWGITGRVGSRERAERDL